MPLCRGALREFDRRTVQPTTHKPPSGNGVSTKPDVADRQALIDAKYYPPKYRQQNNEPNNLHEIKEKLRQRRPSFTTSNDDFQHFESLNSLANNKVEMISMILPIILGRRSIELESGRGCYFGNLKGIDNISKPTPDYYNGSFPEDISQEVWNNLGEYIVPAHDNSRPLLPNFFFELNPPTGNPERLVLKIVQDLAYGARGMQKIRSYGQDQPVHRMYISTWDSREGTWHSRVVHHASHSANKPERGAHVLDKGDSEVHHD